MYLSHFSLKAKPFELLPDPSFMFLSDPHKKALTFLAYGLQEHTGFILFTGEVGTGKTTIIRTLLEKLPDDMVISKIFNTQLNSHELLRMINDDFGIESSSTKKADLLRELNDFLIEQYAQGRRSILIIDEAQNLGPEQLEEVRMLSNLETAQSKLLQIILVGQPELRDRLSSPELIQLRQRILVNCHLSPLIAEESSHYIMYRLEQAGNRKAIAWQAGTLDRIHAVTRGIPRLINILCDYILLDAFSNNRTDLGMEHLDTILENLDFENQFWPEAAPARSSPVKAESPAPLAAMEALMLVAEQLKENAELLSKTLAAACNILQAGLQTPGSEQGQEEIQQ